MSDYISREAAIKTVGEWLDGALGIKESDGTVTVLNKLRKIPAADVVEVIRCKDCRWGFETCGNIECQADLYSPSEYHGYEWFCPNGERREANELCQAMSRYMDDVRW